VLVAVPVAVSEDEEEEELDGDVSFPLYWRASAKREI
jgi:hypothetical protein